MYLWCLRHVSSTPSLPSTFNPFNLNVHFLSQTRGRQELPLPAPASVQLHGQESLEPRRRGTPDGE